MEIATPVPADDFARLQVFVRLHSGNLSSESGSVQFSYDRFAKVFDLGDSFLRVTPHDFGNGSFLLQLVAARLAPGSTTEDLLDRSFGDVPYPTPLIPALDVKTVKRNIGFSGFYLGQSRAAAQLHYREIVKASRDTPDRKAFNLQQGSASERPKSLFNLAESQLTVLYQDDKVVALFWFSMPAPNDGLQREREKRMSGLANLPVLLQGQFNDHR